MTGIFLGLPVRRRGLDGMGGMGHVLLPAMSSTFRLPGYSPPQPVEPRATRLSPDLRGPASHSARGRAPARSQVRQRRLVVAAADALDESMPGDGDPG